ncbi:hypothetical protein MMC12_001943 [Toensbergia leucococca]|nr:hypothetical protein [Toensbergia leucococca]
MILNTHSTRVKLVFVALVVILFLYNSTSLFRRLPDVPSSIRHPFQSSQSEIDTEGKPDVKPELDAQIQFWASLETLLASNRPDCPSPQRVGSAEAVGFNPKADLVRREYLSMPDQDVELMRIAHHKFTDTIKSDPPKMVFNPGTRGLVSTAGGSYLPVFLISLRMLRRTGSSLPMEVFLASNDEYESYFCDNIFPSLNAKCVVLSEILDAIPHLVSITHYQFKAFAMLFSSFDELLFLDADSFPIHDPEVLFQSEPFTSHGMVTWPDFWASSTSELYYKISSQLPPPMNARASCESGELMLSKTTHQRSLLLATYYNYYGPSHYYTIFSQGAPGEGDKETFTSAATVFDEKYYQTSERIRAIGVPKDGGGLAGSAMVQYDPVQDFNLTSHGLFRVEDPSVAEPLRPVFVHANFPKFNPATVFADGVTRHSNGTDRRVWTDAKDTMESFDMDIEKMFWQEIKRTSCEFEDKFQSWKYAGGICSNVMSYWNNVFEEP